MAKRSGKRWPKKRKNGVVFMGRVFHLSAFAREHGLHKSTISLYLSGKRPVDRMQIELAELFAAAFRCSIEDLIAHLREKSAQRANPDVIITAPIPNRSTHTQQ